MMLSSRNRNTDSRLCFQGSTTPQSITPKSQRLRGTGCSASPMRTTRIRPASSSGTDRSTVSTVVPWGSKKVRPWPRAMALRMRETRRVDLPVPVWPTI